MLNIIASDILTIKDFIYFRYSAELKRTVEMSGHAVGLAPCHVGGASGFLQAARRGGDGLFQSVRQTRQTDHDPTQVSKEI